MARAARRASGRKTRAETENESPEPPPAAAAADAVALARDDVDALLDAGIGNVVLTLGALGVALCRREGDEREKRASGSERAPFACTHVPALPPSAGVRSLVGAGDALVAGSAAALAAGHDLASAVAFGAAAARRAVETDANVPSSGVSFGALAADARDAAAAATTTTF
jgi:sugar/nucleoside kinase (ribokinase family)